MTFWRALRDGLSCFAPSQSALSRPEASIPREEEREPEVPALSPARLLAKSMTDCATRDEWKRETDNAYRTFTTKYVNDARSITLARGYTLGSMFGGDWLSTPFTLSKAEEQIVREAMKSFDDRMRQEREAETLARLTAPASGMPLRENAKRSRPKAGSPSRKGMPK